MADEPTLRIPTEFLSIARALATSSDETFNEVLQTLSAPDTSLIDRRQLAERIAQVCSWEASQANQLIDMLVSLRYAQERIGIEDIEEIGRALSGATNLDEGIRSILGDRAAQLMAARDIDLLIRASDLITEHANLLHGARVVSDIRALFRPESTSEIDGAVISHVLILQTARSPETSAPTEVGIDLADLRILKRLIDRAIEKERELRTRVAQLGVPVIMPFLTEEP